MAEQLKKAFPVRKEPPLRLAQETVTNRVPAPQVRKFALPEHAAAQEASGKGAYPYGLGGVIVSGRDTSLSVMSLLG